MRLNMSIYQKKSSELRMIFTILLLLCIGVLPVAGKDAPSEFRFEISFPSSLRTDSITGRVYLIIARRSSPEPRFQVRRASGVPFFGKNIEHLEPNMPAVIDEGVFGFPLKSIKEIPSGDYFIQGFINIYTEFKRSDGRTIWLHNDQWEGQRWNVSPGNIYSDVQKISIHPNRDQAFLISCEHVIPPVTVPEDTKWVKRIKFQSQILTEFWGEPMYLGATILLPKGYDVNPDVYYPVNYVQGHFSLRPPYGFNPESLEEGSTRQKRGQEFTKFWLSSDCPRMIAVTFQHPCPYYDDSYAVNSPNVGPYGDAIMQELIPYIEDEFRIIKEPYARVLSGGSTGGWIALALQIFYPDFFGGTFSLCPDPVDFRSLQLINLYEDKNAYYSEYEWLKVDRPNNRRTDGRIIEMIRDENHFELVVGDKTRAGGQWDIYEAAYGPIGEDGYPKPIWDKMTGEIDKTVAQYWKEHFDLRYLLEKNWEQIGTKLKGKLYIYVGDMDTYYLNNAVRRLEDFLEKTNDPYYDGIVEYGDGEPHCWGPRSAEIIKLFEEHITKNALDKESTKKWKYK
jgi:hypothetical protein